MASSPVAAHQLLWRVRMFCIQQRIAAGQPYWFDNRDRKYSGDSVLQYTMAGQIAYRDEEGQRISGPGSILLFGYDEASEYGLIDDQPYVSRWINLCGPGLSRQWRAIRDRFGSVIDLHGDPRIPNEIERVAALANPRRRTDPLIVAASVQHLVLLLVRVLLEGQAARQTPAERAVEELLRRPAAPWVLKQVADQFGCSREHLVRTFRDKVGQPPGRYLSQARVNAAVRILQHAELPLRQVAQQSGFGTVHTMIRQLKAATGMTPTQLRRQKS